MLDNFVSTDKELRQRLAAIGCGGGNGDTSQIDSNFYWFRVFECTLKKKSTYFLMIRKKRGRLIDTGNPLSCYSDVIHFKSVIIDNEFSVLLFHQHKIKINNDWTIKPFFFFPIFKCLWKYNISICKIPYLYHYIVELKLNVK